jgi:hypothetical protein
LPFSSYSASEDPPPVSGPQRCLSVDASEAVWYLSDARSNCGAASLLN